MTDRELIRKKIEHIVQRRLNLLNGDVFDLTEETKGLTAEIIDSLQEEPVSDDLEEAADNALSNVLNNHEIVNVRSCLEMFRFGSKWQEEKDNEEKVLIYKRGFDDCKEHINEVLLSEVLPYFMHGEEADEVVAKLNKAEESCKVGIKYCLENLIQNNYEED